MITRFTTALVMTTLFFTTAHAQDKKKDDRKPGDEMIEKYLNAEADKLSKKFMDGAKTLEQWQKIRPRLYQEYMDMLGLWPIPEKTPLKAIVTGQIEAHGVIVEKLHFQSKPGLYVTANYYRPKEVKGKLPTILYVCGHSGKGRDGNKTAFQDHGFWFANNGYTCLIVDTLQLGEIAGIHHGTYGLRIGADKEAPTRFWWHSAGYTPAGVECWNGVRAIDYLVTRPEVDPDKIGVTGISGGGAATFWIAAADPRVKVAVPVSGMSDLDFYVKQKGANGHCDCMFLYNTYQWDWTTIAALVAPRPMLFANSDKDPIFPMDANRRIMAKLRDCYKLHGVPNLVEEYVSVGGHDYRPDLRVAIFQFFNKHLWRNTIVPVEDSAKYKDIPGNQLRVFPTDADVPKDQLNTRIDEFFVPKAKVTLPEKGNFPRWRTFMLDDLRWKLFRALPEKIPAAKLVGDSIETESGILVVGSWQAPEKVKGPKPATTRLFLDNHEVEAWAEKSKDNAKLLLGEEGLALALEVRGKHANFGAPGLFKRMPWTTKSPPNYVNRAHALLGLTVDQGRVRDIIATAKMAWKTPTNNKWSVAGFGEDGILAAYAALFEPSIKEVIVINPPSSHKDGPHFLGVLRVLDIPEALGLLAPTPLTIVGGTDPAFDRTEEIYRLAGAADKLKRVK
jgi:cephalosporin-C deacetylase-like acetyl esterase